MTVNSGVFHILGEAVDFRQGLLSSPILQAKEIHGCHEVGLYPQIARNRRFGTPRRAA